MELVQVGVSKDNITKLGNHIPAVISCLHTGIIMSVAVIILVMHYFDCISAFMWTRNMTLVTACITHRVSKALKVKSKGIASQEAYGSRCVCMCPLYVFLCND